MVTYGIIVLATLISFCVSLSYILAYIMKRSLSILSLALFFSMYFVNLLAGLYDITNGYLGVTNDTHNTLSFAILNLILISFVFYTTWKQE